MKRSSHVRQAKPPSRTAVAMDVCVNRYVNYAHGRARGLTSDCEVAFLESILLRARLFGIEISISDITQSRTAAAVYRLLARGAPRRRRRRGSGERRVRRPGCSRPTDPHENTTGHASANILQQGARESARGPNTRRNSPVAVTTGTKCTVCGGAHITLSSGSGGHAWGEAPRPSVPRPHPLSSAAPSSCWAPTGGAARPAAAAPRIW